MHSKELRLVQENHTTEKLVLSIAFLSNELIAKAELNCKSQFLSSEQSCGGGSLNWNSEGKVRFFELEF